MSVILFYNKERPVLATDLSHDVGGVAVAYNPARETMTLAEVLL